MYDGNEPSGITPLEDGVRLYSLDLVQDPLPPTPAERVFLRAYPAGTDALRESALRGDVAAIVQLEGAHAEKLLDEMQFDEGRQQAFEELFAYAKVLGGIERITAKLPRQRRSRTTSKKKPPAA